MTDRAISQSAPSRQDVLAVLTGELKKLLGLESGETIREESRLVEDLGLDSLAMVDLVVLVEERFAVKLSTGMDLTKLATVGDVADLLHGMLRAKAG
jgi:acyl carrier protein